MRKILTGVMALMLAVTAQGQLLWKVSGNGAKGTSYLFGTHHLAPVSMIDEVKGLKEAVSETDATYGEVDMARMSAPEFQQVMLGYLQAPGDSTLSKVLTPLQLDSLNNLLSNLTGGMASASMLEGVKPAVAEIQLVALESMKIFPGFNPNEQFDMTVQELARKSGKPIKGLETVEEQMELLYNKPITEQAEELMATVRDFEKDAELTRRLAESYRSQDFEDLTRMFAEQAAESPEKLDKLLNERNARWLETIRRQLPVETMLISVGAGHLVGPEGLVNALKEAGYTVEPVPAH